MTTLASKSPPVAASLASQNLPRHVRDLLTGTLKTLSAELEGNVVSAVKDFEQQLYRSGELAMEKSGREQWQRTQELVQHARPELLLNFFNAMEAELANLQEPQVLRGHLQSRYRSGDVLALVNDKEIEETSVLTDAANRAELQNSLPLFLLGQRFGVLAGRPAFDAETLPVGPQALCRSIRRAAEQLGLDVDFRVLFYRAFERQVMPGYAMLVEAINLDLAAKGVLPNLQYVPVRARRTEQKSTAGSPAEIREHELALSQGAGGRMVADEDNEAARKAAELLLALTQGGELASEQGFDLLRQLMASRRHLLGKLNPDRSREGREAPHVVDAGDLQEALRAMQNRPAPPLLTRGRVAGRSIAHLKQDMLAMLRRVSPNQEAPALADEHNDALDLVGMLYDNVMKEVRPGSNAAALLTKLQVPLMRVAVEDSAFFTRQEHPARQMLNTLAEAGVHWLEDDHEGGLTGQVHSLVDRAVQQYKGDPQVFRTVMQELVTHLQTLTRKAEVAERRHVEAARGKEKLALAREQASAAIDSLLKNHKLPRFTRTMLSQAWTDVMALTGLRHGEDSAEWQRQLRLAEQLIAVAERPSGAASEPGDAELQRELEDGLSKVGYQGDDISAIARRLVHPEAVTKDDASSRTELTMRLKARARLGEDLAGKRARRIPLTSAEEAEIVRIQQAPIGSWFEFIVNPQGDRVRRRLSWLSASTGDALFVNQRGQKNAEYTLDSLARLMAKGQVILLEEEKGTIIDRAWDNVLGALKSFAVPAAGDAP